MERGAEEEGGWRFPSCKGIKGRMEYFRKKRKFGYDIHHPLFMGFLSTVNVGVILELHPCNYE